jgi:hypothetical protein
MQPNMVSARFSLVGDAKEAGLNIGDFTRGSIIVIRSGAGLDMSSVILRIKTSLSVLMSH